uniref:B-cell receptor CD22 n=2 Tax=Oreochromis niloticus TaxID=8128 RepID=A0A669BTD9_ORENI
MMDIISCIYHLPADVFELVCSHSKERRTPAMRLKGAQAAFICLLTFSAVQGQDGWSVTYTSTQICALKGSTVDIRCTYTYPSRVNGNVTVVEKALWFTKMKGDEHVDVRTEAEFAGRVQYHCDNKDCTLRITDLRESDSAEYTFRFVTNHPGGKYAGSPGVTLSVTVLQAQVIKTWPTLYPTWKKVTCQSGCRLPDPHSYVWYQNEVNIDRKESSFEKYFGYTDSISCAVKGYEKLPSPSVCVDDQTCNRVSYTSRSICALKGSSVDISCIYSHTHPAVSKFWFSPERSHQQQHRSHPEDLRKDSHYAGRVEVIETERGRSTLRIRDLTERDSAEYHFKFKTQSVEWKRSLPGTTLTVTALQVKVSRIISVHQTQTEAELKCESSCSPAGRLSYVWFKNGQKNTTQQTSAYTDYFNPGDNISCAFSGYEDYRSVHVLKLPSVSVSPSGEIVEGSSVTLMCRTHADPAAKNTLYKGNQILPLTPEGIYNFTSISSEDRGIYECKTEDQLSVSLFIDVQYAPKLPSVSVSPSGELVEGSSVTLTCSSDANPAANYTWYKEDDNSAKASGQNFIITDVRPEHSGSYYCEAQNTRGRHNSTSHHLTVVTGKSIIVQNIIRLTSVVLMLIPLLLVILWMRKKKPLSSTAESNELMETMEVRVR